MRAAAIRLLRRGAVALLSAPIHIYRLFISPLFPPTCRFTPSCSAYALEALRRHGPIYGGLLTLRRVSRCHPFKFLGSGSGFDPVPPRRGCCGQSHHDGSEG